MPHTKPYRDREEALNPMYRRGGQEVSLAAHSFGAKVIGIYSDGLVQEAEIGPAGFLPGFPL